MNSNIIWGLLLLLAVPVLHFGKYFLLRLYHQQKTTLKRLLKDHHFKNEVEFNLQRHKLEALRITHDGLAFSRWVLLIGGMFVLVQSLI
jgi:uncharacterized membrane protein